VRCLDGEETASVSSSIRADSVKEDMKSTTKSNVMSEVKSVEATAPSPTASNNNRVSLNIYTNQQDLRSSRRISNLSTAGNDPHELRNSRRISNLSTDAHDMRASRR
jgi:hypothetical protein